MQPISKILTGHPIIPVVVLHAVEDALPLVDALQQGGIDIIEITLRTEAGLGAITRIKKERPTVVVGAGTVLTKEQGKKALKAGADFLVSPGATPALLGWAKRKSVAYLPGVATPSEILQAVEFGCEHVKLFPAEVVGGIPLLKSVASVFPDVSFCPTGGVNPQNYRDYLELPNVMAIGGTWFVSPDRIASGDWEAIAKEVRDIVG